MKDTRPVSGVATGLAVRVRACALAEVAGDNKQDAVAVNIGSRSGGDAGVLSFAARSLAE